MGSCFGPEGMFLWSRPKDATCSSELGLEIRYFFPLCVSYQRASCLVEKVVGQASNPNKSTDVVTFYSFPRNILSPSCLFRKGTGCPWTKHLVLCCLLWLPIGQAWETPSGASKDHANSDPGVKHSVIALIKSLGTFA